MSKTARWALTTGLIFLAFFVALGALFFRQTMDLARGNEYIMEHLGEHIAWDLRQDFRYSSFATLTVGQLVYWIIYWILKKREKKTQNPYMKDMPANPKRIWLIIIPIASIIVAIILAILTLPLWFHL